MSEHRDRDPEELDDWLAETSGDTVEGAGESTPSGGDGELAGSSETSADEGASSAAEREHRRLEREARRRERDEVGGAGGSAGLGGALRRRFSRDTDDQPSVATDGADLSPRTQSPEGDSGLGAGAAELGDSADYAGAGRGARSASGSRPRSYVRRRLMAAGAILGVVALIVVAVVVVGSIGGEDEVPMVVAAPTTDVTIPEGLSRDQIAALAKDEGVRGNYRADSKSSKKINLKKYGAEGAKTLEGFLFPATYNLNEGGTARQLVTRQLQAFEQNIEDVPMKFARSKNLTTYDILKIASMIEREIMVPKERRKAAAVIYNRLSADIPLGIDSTIRFEDSNYDKQLTRSRLEKDSAFNTRIRTGLPPTPIGNPGLAAIEAAANPTRNDLLYFVVKPGTCGEHVFTASEEEFFEAEAAYQRALQREGGSPTDCPE